ncbi:MAG: ComF family protein [Leptolyngbyaceae cyanobacterium MO_188.B28]|nr:ComF family protein [Leptolyngbyaceae cyanobacterium MO_188.B28]
MRQWLIRSVAPVLNLFLEANCPLCGRSTAKALCLDCQRQTSRCRLANPMATWQGDLPLFAWGAYKGSLKRTIAALKYENQPQIAQLLGHWLGEAWLTYTSDWKTQTSSHPWIGSPWVVPIPLHTLKLRQRGFNQADLLAESFCAATGLPLVRKGLVRVRQTKAQFSLTAEERQRNLADSFQIGQAFKRLSTNPSVLLLDDIYTTGSTALAAAKTLQRRGIAVIGIGAIARPLKFPSQSVKEREIGCIFEA